MTSELKPCPFCGGKAIYTEDNGEYRNHITCTNDKCKIRISGVWLEDPTTVERWNTRAVPDMPELVPVAHMLQTEMTDIDGETYKDFVHVHLGCSGSFPVVRYDQAAAMLAALDNQASVAEYKLDQAVRVVIPMMQERAKAAEVELAQIKEQKPVAEFGARRHTPENTPEFFGFLINGAGLLGGTPLYAAPVDQTAEIERLRNGLSRLVRNGQKQGWNDSYEDDMNYARATLSGKEPS